MSEQRMVVPVEAIEVTDEMVERGVGAFRKHYAQAQASGWHGMGYGQTTFDAKRGVREILEASLPFPERPVVDEGAKQRAVDLIHTRLYDLLTHSHSDGRQPFTSEELLDEILAVLGAPREGDAAKVLELLNLDIHIDGDGSPLTPQDVAELIKFHIVLVRKDAAKSGPVVDEGAVERLQRMMSEYGIECRECEGTGENGDGDECADCDGDGRLFRDGEFRAALAAPEQEGAFDRVKEYVERVMPDLKHVDAFVRDLLGYAFAVPKTPEQIADEARCYVAAPEEGGG